MKNESFSTHSKTDYDFLQNGTDDEIDLSDIPEISEEQLAEAVWTFGGKPISRKKVQVTMYLDADVLAFFQTQAEEEEAYQALINQTLRKSIGQESLQTLLRQLIREELAG